MVAQVDEEQAAVIAFAMDPAGQARWLARIGDAELAAGVGAIGVHGVGVRRFRGPISKRRGRAHAPPAMSSAPYSARVQQPAGRFADMLLPAINRLVLDLWAVVAFIAASAA